MAGPDDLVLCAGSLLAASFEEIADAASAGGFAAISLWPQHVAGAGASPTELRTRLADRGLALLELEPLLSWLPEGSLPEALRGFVGPPVDGFLELAAAIGAEAVLAVDGFGARAEREEIAEAFAALCDGAAQRGLRVELEFTPWSAIPDAAEARAILDLADRTNAGLMLDSWHFFRGANDLAQIEALPGRLVAAVQINDAPQARPADLVDESLHGRLPPGEGAIDLVGLLRSLDAIGCRAPIGVEVFSDALAGQPAAELGRRLGDAARAVLARARR